MGMDHPATLMCSQVAERQERLTDKLEDYVTRQARVDARMEQLLSITENNAQAIDGLRESCTRLSETVEHIERSVESMPSSATLEARLANKVGYKEVIAFIAFGMTLAVGISAAVGQIVSAIR